MADPVPSYATHAEVIMLGNLEEGLRAYLIDPVRLNAAASRERSKVMQAGNAE